jgi:hypothetical protein
MPDQDRRKHPRIPIQIDIAYDNDVVLTQTNVQDISLGGANVLTALPLPVGTRLSIWFRGADPNLELKARVLRVTEEDPDDEATRPGMGIQFFGISSQEEEAIQALIDWYVSQPAPQESVSQEMPKVEEVDEQRYIKTQIISITEATPKAAAPIKLPIEASYPEPVDLEVTQLETPERETSEYQAPNPFEATTSSDDSIQTVRLHPEELEAQRIARAAQRQDSAFETLRIHPEDLNALQSAAQDASGTINHDHNDTITLPEMPAVSADNESGEHPADSGERKAKKKRKR